MPSEFDLIARHFTRPTRHTRLGIGDDCALMQPAAGMLLAVSCDMLVSGTHFLPTTDPENLGWKSLAVSVSDLAAMAARPRWATLALALPPERAADDNWLSALSRGLFACADAFDIDLAGGDTTRGPLNLCLTLFGEVAPGMDLQRGAAEAGDELWVSGQPGLAALGLAHLQGRCQLPAPARCIAALERPQPRLSLGLALAGRAHAAIDVSDGLLADLGHLLRRSGVAAQLDAAALPGEVFQQGAAAALARDCLLAGGDDYELLFTAPPARHDEILALAGDCPVHAIGRIVAGAAGEITLQERNGRSLPLAARGFDHFQDSGTP